MPNVTTTMGLRIKIRFWVPGFIRAVALAARLRIPLPEAALQRFLATYGWTATTVVTSPLAESAR